MSLQLKDGSLIHHIPKTGGMYVRQLLERNGIEWMLQWTKDPAGFDTECVKPFPATESYHLCCKPHGRRALSIIRDPAAWYESYWLFRCHTKWTWDEERPLDRQCANNYFGVFVTKVFAAYPDGFLNQLYAAYLANSTEAVNLEDAHHGLELFLERPLVNIGKVNARRTEMFPHNLAWQIREHECIAAELWYMAALKMEARHGALTPEDWKEFV